MTEKRKKTAPRSAAADDINAPDLVERRGYTVGTWKGHPNFSCTLSKYETLDERSMILHVAGVRSRAAALELPRVSRDILDANGEPMAEG